MNVLLHRPGSLSFFPFSYGAVPISGVGGSGLVHFPPCRARGDTETESLRCPRADR